MNDQKLSTLHEQMGMLKVAGCFILTLSIVSYILPVLGIQLRLVQLLAYMVPAPRLLLAGFGLFLILVACLRDPGPDREEMPIVTPLQEK